MYAGKADWGRIARLKEALAIPVIGNGDVTTARDVTRMFQQTGCDGVMIGRASMKNPWIYRQAVQLLAGREVEEPSIQDRRRVILEHFALVLAQEDGRMALHKLRTFTGWYTHGLPGGRQLRMRINSLDTVEAFLEAVHGFFDRASMAA
jgi:tRNA-dihydrouridine synthase